MLRPHQRKVIGPDAHDNGAAVGSTHWSSPRGRRPGVVGASGGNGNGGGNADPTQLSTGTAVEPAGRRRESSSRAVELNTRSYSRSHSADYVDDSSTVSATGTAVTEEGWGSGSGQGSDAGGATGRGLEKGVGYGNEPQGAATTSKLNSLRRVLDSAR